MHEVIVRYRFHRLACLPPCAQSTYDHEGIESAFPQQMRHPGARGFARSSAVDVDVLLSRQKSELLRHVIGLKPDGAFDARSL
jgi:hypothetical protein